MGFGQVFDNLTCTRMDALRKQIQSLVDYAFELLLLDTCSLKQSLTTITRI